MARILLADDDGAVRELIARGLNTDGHDVVIAEDGTEALEQIRSGSGFDLLISDVEMPGLDGISLVEAGRAAQPALRVLMVSGFAEQLQRADGIDGARVQTLLKPFALADIRAAVKAALDG